MTGAVSRASLAEAAERLHAVLPSATLSTLGDELFAVLHLIDTEHGLRRALSDPSRSGEDKAQLMRALLAGKLSAAGVTLAADVVRLRWTRPSELSDAFEKLAVAAQAARAEDEGKLDDLEDELFRFSRIIEAEPRLRGALASIGLPADRKRGLLDELLAGKTTESGLALIAEAVLHPRGRSLERGLAEYGRLVAARRSRLVALVRTAVVLSEEQRARLGAALAAQYGHDVHLNIELDPTVLGGLAIQIGDEAIDGTIAGRLDDVRRRLAS